MPKEAKAGEIIEIRVIVQHPMETGYRYDDVGKLIPRNTIRTLVCCYNGEEILRAEMSSGIAANPYLQFSAKVEESGTFKFSWTDDDGTVITAEEKITVA